MPVCTSIIAGPVTRPPSQELRPGFWPPELRSSQDAAAGNSQKLRCTCWSELRALVYVSAALAVDPTLTLALPVISHVLSVYLVPLIAFASLIWHRDGAVSKACEEAPALAQLKKWSLCDRDPLMYTLEHCFKLQHIAVARVLRDVCGCQWPCCVISKYSSVATSRFKLRLKLLPSRSLTGRLR
jgi:hypothetical protein